MYLKNIYNIWIRVEPTRAGLRAHVSLILKKAHTKLGLLGIGLGFSMSSEMGLNQA